MKRNIQIESQVVAQVRIYSASLVPRLAISAAVILFGIALVIGFSAAANVQAVSMRQAQATATPASGATVPGPVSSVSVPAAQNTGVAQSTRVLPNPEETQRALAVENTRIASLPTTAPVATVTAATSDTSDGSPAPPANPGAAPGRTSQGGTAGAASFPWLPLLLLGAALLGGLLYFLSRRRTPEPEPVLASPAHRPDVSNLRPYDSGPQAVTTTSAVTTPNVAVLVVPLAASAVAPAPFVPPVTPPTTIDCPNCGTSNGFNEHFCHECGQDLRPLRASLLAAIAPPPEIVSDVVTETTPYLETVSRVDEQLEYVLSRSRVLIGTAPGSDIVIDSLFQGWQTVDPTHAELRRESEGFVLVDRGSGSGTFVNEMRTGENLLAEGDVIRVGDVQFIFRVPA